MDKMYLHIIKGNEGYCLNLMDDSGDGQRILGCKPWGNPFNKPTFTFEVDKDDLTQLRNIFDYYINEMK